ncbi:MAG: Gfo/Idh/MocA family oxidoreductase [Planctomycetes bacterium]|nr:Gfo/Idh/MocA family oxidoreductase [Planctomycetota bacterium]
MDIVRIGIVGCGGIARAHLTAYRAIPGVEVAAVYDVSPTACESFAREAGAIAATSLAAMADMRLDAVSICTPPGARIDCCRPFLSAGIAVLCEKPLAVDGAAARELATLAAASTSLFMTAFCHRFHGPVLELKKLIDSGTLGQPVLVRMVFAGRFELQGNHRCDPKLAGGGCIMDNGTHAVDLFRFLVGDIGEIQAMTATAVQDAAVEDVGTIGLRSTSGVLAEIATSFSAPSGANWIEWFASAGTARVSYWNAGHPDLAYCLAGTDAWVPIDCSAYPSRFEGQLRHFIACVRSGSRPSPTVDDGLAASLAIAGAYASARSGERIGLGAALPTPARISPQARGSAGIQR